MVECVPLERDGYKGIRLQVWTEIGAVNTKVFQPGHMRQNKEDMGGRECAGDAE